MGCLKLPYLEISNANLGLTQNPFKKTLTSVKSEKKMCSSYLFGFNGKERENEVYGEGNTYSFEARTFDSRIGKWLSLDPREREYPWQTPYAYFANCPITKIDFMGEGGNDVSLPINDGGGTGTKTDNKKTVMEQGLGYDLDDLNVSFQNKQNSDGKFIYTTLTFSNKKTGELIGSTNLDKNNTFFKQKEGNKVSSSDLELLSRDENFLKPLTPEMYKGGNRKSNNEMIAIAASIKNRAAFSLPGDFNNGQLKSYYSDVSKFVVEKASIVAARNWKANYPNRGQATYDTLRYLEIKKVEQRFSLEKKGGQVIEWENSGADGGINSLDVNMGQ
jgi:RHS repeat-associated protein